MKSAIEKFKIQNNTDFNLAEMPTKIKDLYDSKDEYEQYLEGQKELLAEWQNKLYAHHRHGVLIIFQAMDAAGKDGTINAVFSSVDPNGINVQSFKRPSEEEINHDYMWRCIKYLPERGKIQIFNRSYYEEVLVVKVHPEILAGQKIPEELKNADIFETRYADIVNFENYMSHNGFKVIKFFLNVSKKEQADRLIERIKDKSKNWKFEANDVKERELWDEYMNAYQTMIQKTATAENPWYVIPADDKKNMRMLVMSAIMNEINAIKVEYPTVDQEMLLGLIKTIEDQNSQP